MDTKSNITVPPGIQYIAENIKSKQNIMGSSPDAKASWAKNLNLPKQSETIFFAGCGYQYSAGLGSLMSLIRKMDKSFIGSELPMAMAGLQKKVGFDLAGLYNKFSVKDIKTESNVLIDAVRVLKNLNIDFGYLGEDEPCCGGLLHYAGMEQDFISNSQSLSAKLKSNNIKRIISIVPSCTFTLKNLVTKYVKNSEIEILHFSEAVLSNLKSKTLKYPQKVRVTYHDPCQLSRFLRIVDEPRQILRQIGNIEFVEPESTSREWSTCCGGGGGFEAVFPELSEILAVNRAMELADTGADIIVTSCPGCIMQIEDGLKQLKNTNIAVMDLAQVIARAMEK
jgi:dimethylglycine catabolism B